MIITMLCFGKQKNSKKNIVSFSSAPSVIIERVDPHQDTRIQSSEEEPTPSTKLDEGPLPEPNTGASGCETHESREGQTLQYTDETKQCQFREESEGLPPSLVTAIESPQCPHHTDKSLDLYCPSHQVPVCPVCASTTHLRCPVINNIENVFQEKSEQLWDFLHVLTDHQNSVAELRRKVEAKLKSKEDDQKAEALKSADQWSRGSPQKMMVLLPFHAPVNTPSPEAPATSQDFSGDNSSSTLITLTAPPGFLLHEIQLSPQFSPHKSPYPKVKVYAMTGQSFGLMQPSPKGSPTETRRGFQPYDDRPHGPALVRVLEIGHRVKRCADEGGRNLGTVVAIPSAGTTSRSGDTSGLVDVRWDAGGEGSYRMGSHNHYELELA